jgi:nucleoside-triphosphatase THEP1
MDELGHHENEAINFKKRIYELLEGEIPILGVLQKCDSEFLENISKNDNVKLIEINHNNIKHIENKIQNETWI